MDRHSIVCTERTPVRMEFPSLDKRCSHPDCMLLDFLPLECQCKLLFCSRHFTSHAGECRFRVDATTDDTNRIQDLYKCSEVGCNSTSLVALMCEKCHKHFCVTHRHVTGCSPADPEIVAKEKEKYAAPVRQFNEAKASIDKEVRVYITKTAVLIISVLIKVINNWFMVAIFISKDGNASLF